MQRLSSVVARLIRMRAYPGMCVMAGMEIPMEETGIHCALQPLSSKQVVKGNVVRIDVRDLFDNIPTTVPFLPSQLTAFPELYWIET